MATRVTTMEVVDQSPEEYFRQHAAAALLHNSDDESADDNAHSNNSKEEAWSEIEDNSGAEDDSAVLRRKRVLRHGRERLTEMKERFNAAKKRLVEARKSQLDLEMSQLRDGTHPQYKEYMDQIDARWNDRLDKIKEKMEYSRNLAQLNFDSSKRSAANTFIASRAELRHAMILQRKKKMWALADRLRGLERLREAIIDIAYPQSNVNGPAVPIKGIMASPESSHLLDLPDTYMDKADQDADISAAYGIHTLLNYDDVVYDDAMQGLAINNGAAGADMQVPGYHSGEMNASQHGSEDVIVVNGAAAYGGVDILQDYQQQQPQQQQQQQQAYLSHQTISEAPHMAYNASGSRHDSVTAPAATASTNNASSIAAAPHTYSMSAAGMNNPGVAQTHYNDPSYQKPHYYDTGSYKASASSANISDMQHKPAVEADAAAAAAAAASGYTYGGNGGNVGVSSKRQHAYSNGRADDYHTASGYYDGGAAAGSSGAAPVPASNGYTGAREGAAYDYDGNAQPKRQRVAQQSTNWSGSPPHYHQQPQQYAYQQESREWQEPSAPGFSKNGYQATDPESAPPPYSYNRHEEQHHRIYKGTSGDGAGASAAAYQSQYHSQGQVPRDDQYPYHYSQTNPDYHRQGASSAYYGSQKYEYPSESSAYYHQQQQQQQQRYYQAQDGGYYQAPSHYQQQAQPSAGRVSGGAPVASHQTDAYYQGSSHHYSQQQQPLPASGSFAAQPYHSHHHSHHASNSSYSGLDAGISMPAPSSSSTWDDYYSQQAKTNGSRAQQPHYPSSHSYQQQQHARQDGIPEYGGDPNGYYRNSQQAHSMQHPQQPQSQGQPQHPGGGASAYHRRQLI
ncbi:hypothetical protein LPJ53_003944 [Coemansia erecta]|uniref:Uncharacterized protein n=1 Tax=Coemansia erecta TaxID=147472 RepID=A0A9W8CRG2_9FUNG|nr:hypothetical protein LPJ53_003944 [Coemansia erecta]